MASSSAKADRVYHGQDYSARIRYSNVLPPPPIPPKLLDIPNTGLSSGQYTSAAFASRLAREQPLNIEADAELGMPIDIVGLPGVFNGDESAISGLENPPPPHPNDKPLLRPLSMLGKSSSTMAGVSFLRRTEYISSDQSRSNFTSTTSRDLVKLKPKRRFSEMERDNDPVRIKQKVIKSFNIAYPEDASSTGGEAAPITGKEAAAWSQPVHPANPGLQLVDSYPLLPDHGAVPDMASYTVIKFQNNPVPVSDKYDARLDATMFQPVLAPEAEREAESQLAAHNANPSAVPAPDRPKFDYNFFLPEDRSVAHEAQEAFKSRDGERQEDESFRYGLVRTYMTYQQTWNGEGGEFSDVVAIALHDEDTGSKVNGHTTSRDLQKAAYVYPIMQRTFIRAKRGFTGRPGAAPANEHAAVDFLDISMKDPEEDVVTVREEALSNHRIQEPAVAAAS